MKILRGHGVADPVDEDADLPGDVADGEDLPEGADEIGLAGEDDDLEGGGEDGDDHGDALVDGDDQEDAVEDEDDAEGDADV